jgi:hypothetical protein
VPGYTLDHPSYRTKKSDDRSGSRPTAQNTENSKHHMIGANAVQKATRQQGFRNLVVDIAATHIADTPCGCNHENGAVTMLTTDLK